VLGLALGLPTVSAFGAVGAVSVGFGSFQGAYRSRAEVMLYAAAAMALSVFVGSLAGYSDTAAIVTGTVAAFASGLLIAVGPAAAFVGLQSVVAVLIAGGFPTDPASAALRAAIVLGGGLVQTLLVVLIWPLRRFSAERTTIASAYRSLAGYAAQMFTAEAAAPEPHTFAAAESPLADPQPFARPATCSSSRPCSTKRNAFAPAWRRSRPGSGSCSRSIHRAPDPFANGPAACCRRLPRPSEADASPARTRRCGRRSRPARASCRMGPRSTDCSAVARRVADGGRPRRRHRAARGARARAPPPPSPGARRPSRHCGRI
jgi:hypothetical protein